MIRNTGEMPKKRKFTEFDFSKANIQNEFGVCGWILTILSYLLILVTLPISACMCIKVVQEYERAVIFRLGRLMPGGAKGPGIFLIVPCIDTYRKVDLRVLSFEVPPQEILSKDSVTVAVDAVVYFRISNATISVTNVEDAARSTKLLAQTTLRNILGTKTLAEMLSDREAISHQMQTTLDEATEPWGVKVERVEVKDVRLPVQLQRAMAAEAEAAREARAKVIVAEGEQKASRALKEAAEVIAQSPSAIQLRYLQTLNSISAEKNSTIIFPFPIDLLTAFLQRPAPKVEEPPPLPKKIRSCCLYKYPDWVQGMVGEGKPPVSGQQGHQCTHSPHQDGSRLSTTATSGRPPLPQSMREAQYHSAAAAQMQQTTSNMPSQLDPGSLYDPTRRAAGARNSTRGGVAANSLLKQAIANRLKPTAPGELASSSGVGDNSRRDSDEMNKSIVMNPAWYRDNEGRTGFKTKEFEELPNMQKEQVKTKKIRTKSEKGVANIDEELLENKESERPKITEERLEEALKQLEKVQKDSETKPNKLTKEEKKAIKQEDKERKKLEKEEKKEKKKLEKEEKRKEKEMKKKNSQSSLVSMDVKISEKEGAVDGSSKESQNEAEQEEKLAEKRRRKQERREKREREEKAKGSSEEKKHPEKNQKSSEKASSHSDALSVKNDASRRESEVSASSVRSQDTVREVPAAVHRKPPTGRRATGSLVSPQSSSNEEERNSRTMRVEQKPKKENLGERRDSSMSESSRNSAFSHKSVTFNDRVQLHEIERLQMSSSDEDVGIMSDDELSKPDLERRKRLVHLLQGQQNANMFGGNSPSGYDDDIEDFEEQERRAEAGLPSEYPVYDVENTSGNSFYPEDQNPDRYIIDEEGSYISLDHLPVAVRRAIVAEMRGQPRDNEAAGGGSMSKLHQEDSQSNSLLSYPQLPRSASGYLDEQYMLTSYQQAMYGAKSPNEDTQPSEDKLQLSFQQQRKLQESFYDNVHGRLPSRTNSLTDSTRQHIAERKNSLVPAGAEVTPVPSPPRAPSNTSLDRAAFFRDSQTPSGSTIPTSSFVEVKQTVKPPKVVITSTITSTTTNRQEVIEKTEKAVNENDMQRKFVARFGARKAPMATDDDPTDPCHFMGSQESVLSNQSRESVISAASIRKESTVRRNFNY